MVVIDDDTWSIPSDVELVSAMPSKATKTKGGDDAGKAARAARKAAQVGRETKVKNK